VIDLEGLSLELQQAFLDADEAIELCLANEDAESLEEAREMLKDCLELSREYAGEIFKLQGSNSS
jgi:predicted RNase H-like HicB family nuclease